MEIITFEKLCAGHGKRVMEIYNYYIENSFAAYPEEKFPEEFFGRFLEMTKGFPAYAILSNNEVVGFCFLRPYNPIPAFKETAEITYFIDENHTGKGLGKEALKLLEKEAAGMGISTILASITSKNSQSLAFHKKHGFLQYGLFPAIGKKFSHPFDIVWMGKKI